MRQALPARFETLELRQLLSGSNAIDRLDFGNLASEAAHHFEPGVAASKLPALGTGTVGASSGLMYRRATAADPLTFTLAVDPARQNYLSIRMWGNDVPTNTMTLIGGGPYENIEDAGGNVQFPNRFLYHTLPIPITTTSGKKYVELTLTGGRPVYSVYSHTATQFTPDSADLTGAKPAATGQATLDTITNAEATAILQALRERIYDSGEYYDDIVARQVTAGTAGAPVEAYGLDLWTNVSNWGGAIKTHDQWRDQIGGGQHGGGYSTFPDEMLSVFYTTYLLKPFKDVNNNTVAGLDHYRDPALLQRIVNLMDGSTYLQGSDGRFNRDAGTDLITGLNASGVWQGLTSTPRAAGHPYAGSTARGQGWGLSLEGVDTYTLGMAIIQLMNDPVGGAAFQASLAQSFDADLNGGSMLRATAYERMLYNHVNYLRAVIGGTESQNMFQQLGMYACHIALQKIQALYPNAAYVSAVGNYPDHTYVDSSVSAVDVVKMVMGLIPTTLRGPGSLNGNPVNYGMTRQGLGEAEGALDSGFDGGGYGQILPALSTVFWQLVQLDPGADAATRSAVIARTNASINTFNYILYPQDFATVNSSGVVTANTYNFAEESFITYRDTKNVNTTADRFNFNPRFLASDPQGGINNPEALRSAYLVTQYGQTVRLDGSAGNGAPGGALDYLKQLPNYEATIRALVNVNPATLDPLPAEPGQPDYTFADLQNGAVAFSNNGERLLMNANWRNGYFNGGNFTTVGNIARIHFTTPTVERAAVVIMPKDAATLQSDGNLTGTTFTQPWVVRYGDYLVVLNNTASPTTVSLPAGTGIAKDLVSQNAYPLGASVNVAGGQYAIFWLNASSVTPALVSGADIGAVGAAGSNSYANGIYTVSGAGADIGGGADAFRLVSTPVSGDATVAGQILSQTGAASAEAGVMIRADTTAGSAFAAVLRSPGSGIRFEYRSAAGGTTAWVAVPTPLSNIHVKLTRTGNSVAAWYSTGNASWTQIGASQIVALPASVMFGLAVSSHNTAATSTATFGSFAVAPGVAPTVAAAAAASSTTVTGASVNLSVLGVDDGGEGNLTYTWTLLGNPPEPVTFSANKTNAAKNTTATFITQGVYDFRVLIKDGGGATTSSDVTVTVNSTATAVVVTPASTLVGQGAQVLLYATVIDQFGQPLEKPPTIAWSVDVGGVGGSADPSGRYTAPVSGSGAATVRATAGALSGTAAMTVQPSVGLFSSTQAIGAPALAGAASFVDATGTYSVSAGGTDIWGTSDQFRFVYIPMTGDGTITARVVSMNNTNTFAKAGVMFRTSLDANSPYAINYISPNNGTRFEYRRTAGGTSASAGGGLTAGTPPAYVRLTREGAVISAAYSSDGVNWTTQPTTEAAITGMTAGSTVYVGLVVCSHNTAAINNVSFDNVTVGELRNRAVGGIATANPVGGANETAVKAFDGLTSTKWYGAPGTSAWLQYNFNAGIQWAVVRYSITSANDVPARDPRDWQLQGSNDGSAWNTLDTRAGETFGARFLTKTYSLENLVAYQYYRLNVTANAGASNVGVQLSELTLFSATQPGQGQGVPTLVNPASASSGTVTGTTVNLSALGADNAGEPALTYTWSLVNLPPGNVTFSANGTNAAKNSTATFTRAGTYFLRVTLTDANGQIATSDVTVTVNQTLSSVLVSPLTPTIVPGATKQFTAVALDQFGQPLASQPPSFIWSLASGSGSINASGVYTAPIMSASASVRATTGAVNGTTSITTTNQTPLIASSTGATAAITSGNTAALTVPAVDDTGEPGLTYTWATVGSPPAPVTFSPNSSNTAKNSTATFSANGTYTFIVTITDAAGVSTTANLTLIVTNYFPSTITGTNGNDTYVLRLDPANNQIEQLFINTPTTGSPTYSIDKSLLNNLAFYTLGGDDTVTIDLANGNPVPAGGVLFDGGVNGSSAGDGLFINGTAAVDTFSIDAANVINPSGGTITYASIERVQLDLLGSNDGLTQTAQPAAAVTFNGGTGADVLNVNAGSFAFASDAISGSASLSINVSGVGSTVTFTGDQHLAALNLTAGGSAALTTSASASTPALLNFATALDITGIGSTLDLTNNRLLAVATLASVRSMIIDGRLDSSTLGGVLGSLDLGGGSVEVRYTLRGDTNLDGAVDVSDLGNLASGYGSEPNAVWGQGDFNYNGTIDVSDLGDLASNYGTSLGGATATPASVVSSAGLARQAASASPSILSSQAMDHRSWSMDWFDLKKRFATRLSRFRG